MRQKSSFKTGLQISLSLEINHGRLDSYISFDKSCMAYPLQNGDHFFLNKNSGWSIANALQDFPANSVKIRQHIEKSNNRNETLDLISMPIASSTIRMSNFFPSEEKRKLK
jgi:hypothetical protein